MCDVCCKEFKGWCQSFSRTERAFTILEAILLVLLIVLMVFLILHLLVCPMYDDSINDEDTVDKSNSTTTTTIPNNISDTSFSATGPTGSMSTTRKTTTPDIDCTWTPSHKTIAFTHYFENGATKSLEPTAPSVFNDFIKYTTTQTDSGPLDAQVERLKSIFQDQDKIQNEYVMALVKWRPPQDVVFGCIVTIITKYWVLTTASCIAAIEEVDSLDTYVIVEDYGTSSNGNIHSIVDYQTHPFYSRGASESYDLAALKSDSGLINMQVVELPSLLDHLLITPGERFYILEFEVVRKESRRRARGPRRVRVHTLPAARCGRRTARHLRPKGAAPAPAPPPPPLGPLCAGTAAAPGRACYTHCSGTPLLRGGKLFGLMSDRRQCAAACEPQPYVAVAAPPVRTWIDSFVDEE